LAAEAAVGFVVGKGGGNADVLPKACATRSRPALPQNPLGRVP